VTPGRKSKGGKGMAPKFAMALMRNWPIGREINGLKPWKNLKGFKNELEPACLWPACPMKPNLFEMPQCQPWVPNLNGKSP